MKKIVFIFGRFQVPTKGHAEMIRYAANLAHRTGAEFRVYTSKTQDSNKNPLPYHVKLMYLRMLFPKINVVSDRSISVFDVCKNLAAEGFEDVTLVTGGDRVQEFQKQIGKYVKDRSDPTFDPSKNYPFKSFKVVNSGNRRTGVSGTDMRNFIRKGEIQKFLQTAPTTDKELAKSIFKTAKSYLKEETLEERHFEPTVKRVASVGSFVDHIKNKSLLDHPSIRTANKTKRAAIEKALHPKKKKVKEKDHGKWVDSWVKKNQSAFKSSSSHLTSFSGWSKSHTPASYQSGSNSSSDSDPVLGKWKNFKYPHTSHSNRILTPKSGYPEEKIYKNPDPKEFDKLINKDGGVRILRANDDWYVWVWHNFIHTDVIKKYKLGPGSIWDMPHVDAANRRIPNGMIGISLNLMSDAEGSYIIPESDVIYRDSMEWVLSELRKDKKFTKMTQNWRVKDVHDKITDRKQKTQLSPAWNLTRDQLAARIQRDMDMNLAEGNRTAQSLVDKVRIINGDAKQSTIARQKKKHPAASFAINQLMANPPKKKTRKPKANKVVDNSYSSLDHSMRSISNPRGSDEPIEKNPSTAKFDKLMKGSWNKYARFFWNEGDWYFWNGYMNGNHQAIYSALGINKSPGLPHVDNVENRRPNSLYGATLSAEPDWNTRGSDKETDKLYVVHDLFSKADIKWICQRLKSNKAFIETTKNWHVVGVHDHGLPEGSRKKVVNPNAKIMTRDQLRAKIQRDIDLNLAEAKTTNLPSWILKNPSNAEFERLMQTSSEANRIDNGARLIKLKNIWYVWEASKAIHSEVLQLIMGDKFNDIVFRYRGVDNYRRSNKIPGFQIMKKAGKYYWWSDPEYDQARRYLELLSRDMSFRKMLGDKSLSFKEADLDEELPPLSSKRNPRKSNDPHRRLSRDELRMKIQRDMDLNLAEEVSRDDFKKMLKGFIDFTANDLGISELPHIEYKDSDEHGEQPSFGCYSPHSKKLTIMTKNRHPMDIFRTVAHELVHHKQNLEGRLGHSANEGSDGSEIENEANSRAAVTMRKFGKANPGMFSQSYVTEENLLEGINDKGIFKAVFLAGGSGSGKDYILKQCIAGNGLKELNSDQAFEHIMKKNNLPLTMDAKDRPLRDRLRGQAKETTMKQKKLQLGGRLGVIVNGTADDYTKISELKKSYEELGYDTMMVFVGTSNKISRQRNISRGKEGGREVPEDIRFSKWMGSNKNKDRFAQLFGSNFIFIDNSVDSRTGTPEQKAKASADQLRVYKTVAAFVSRPVRNPKALEWMTAEKRRRGISEADERFGDMLNEVGGAGNWGTGKLTGRYQKDTPGQHIGFHNMKVLDLSKFHKKEVKEEKPVIGADRVGPEYGFPKSPGMGDNQSLSFNTFTDPISKWMVKEETRKMFKERYGKLAEQKLIDAAKKFQQAESLDDPFSPAMGATPNSWNQEDNRPGNGKETDAEKQSLFGFRLKKQKKNKTK